MMLAPVPLFFTTKSTKGGTSKKLPKIFVSSYFSTINFVENEVFSSLHYKSFVRLVRLCGKKTKSSLFFTTKATKTHKGGTSKKHSLFAVLFS
jgi:hypothetical protein